MRDKSQRFLVLELDQLSFRQHVSHSVYKWMAWSTDHWRNHLSRAFCHSKWRHWNSVYNRNNVNNTITVVLFSVRSKSSALFPKSHRYSTWYISTYSQKFPTRTKIFLFSREIPRMSKHCGPVMNLELVSRYATQIHLPVNVPSKISPVRASTR